MGAVRGRRGGPLWLAVLIAAVAFVIAGCGSSNSSSSKSSSTSSSAAPEKQQADTSKPPEPQPAVAAAHGRPARRSRSRILSDCQGAFGSFDNQDMAGAVSALQPVRRRQAEEPEQAA